MPMVVMAEEVVMAVVMAVVAVAVVVVMMMTVVVMPARPGGSISGHRQRAHAECQRSNRCSEQFRHKRFS
jgi:hypothetical protein